MSDKPAALQGIAKIRDRLAAEQPKFQKAVFDLVLEELEKIHRITSDQNIKPRLRSNIDILREIGKRVTA